MLMNSKKFNVYKSAKYSYIASAILLVAGLVMGIVLGLNSTITISGSAILNSVLSVIIFGIIALIYFSIKYSFYVGFTTLLAVFHNTMLVTALVAIIRIPVEESFMMVLLAVCAITVVMCAMILGDKRTDYHKTTDRENLVNELMASKLKTLLWVFISLLVVAVAFIFTFEASMMNIIRPLLVGLVVCLYSSIFMVTPFWGYFVKEKKVRKQVNLEEQDYVK